MNTTLAQRQQAYARLLLGRAERAERAAAGHRLPGGSGMVRPAVRGGGVRYGLPRGGHELERRCADAGKVSARGG